MLKKTGNKKYKISACLNPFVISFGSGTLFDLIIVRFRNYSKNFYRFLFAGEPQAGGQSHEVRIL